MPGGFVRGREQGRVKSWKALARNFARKVRHEPSREITRKSRDFKKHVIRQIRRGETTAIRA